MDDYAGRVLAGRYRLPRLPSDAYDLVETRAFDTHSGHEVALRRIHLPEVVEAEVLEPAGPAGLRGIRPGTRRATRSPGDPAVQRALDAAAAVALIPDHPRLDQVFDVFAEDDSLWIAGEQVRARPLAALLAEGPITAHRAAEIAADVLTALRALHVHGWTHRNITTRTVLVCDDGRAVLTGLAAGAAEEALCGYDPLPHPPYAPADEDAESPGSPGAGPGPSKPRVTAGASGDRAARAGAIAAYRAGVQAGVRAGSGAPEPDAPRRRLPSPRVGSTAELPAATPATASAGPAAGARWDDLLHRPESDRGPQEPGPYRGPETQLAAERARQARIIMVGAVTERWAPEQAGPVHANWRLAAPVGPATDLWALGALLFRAVQGHAPYPEDDAAELVQLVCAEPPAFAEECGPLRPIVESLLRQDPDERPDIEELRGWLRSLVRSAPEPEAGSRTVTAPALDASRIGPLPALGAAVPGRLPVLRRRGEIVRRRRADAPVTTHGRHKRKPQKRRSSPRALGLTLVGLVLLGLAVAVAFAVFALPADGPGVDGRAGAPGTPSRAAEVPGGKERADGERTGDDGDGSQDAQSTAPADLAKGFEIRKDPAGFQIAVRDGWDRRGENSRGQIRYVGDDGCELIVVPGRDTVAGSGKDPMVYQQDKERELAPFRESQWSSASGLRRIDVGRTAMAEGTFTWKDSSGRDVHARNIAMILGDRYHVVLVIGPSDRSEDVDRYFEQASTSYRTSG
ncbi:serine/threonine protein kinase [Streptomyces meridianus]|uniref:Serine/threonine protein kinase n=1 Tax=Streptomyces meridianus TaxID=2938945 RepID=A0ABT0X5W9_9ACTN|nr:serine/threonine protein kinase [Streptomyces meridianus]MCM2577655.1 serine/threonine protein kinase [Streptomyces meridianus]